MTTTFYVQFTNALRPAMTERRDVSTIDDALAVADNPKNWPYGNTRVQVFERLFDGYVKEIDITSTTAPTTAYTEAEIAPLAAALAGDPLTEFFGEPIDVVTRADLLSSGDLVEVAEDIKRDAGMPGSVALTRAAWEDAVAWSEADNDRKGTVQDESGRAWDVLWMLSRTIRRCGRNAPTPVDGLLFSIVRVPREGRGRKPRGMDLKAMFGVCDDGVTPALTIGLVNED